MGEEGERVEIERRCLDRVSSEVFENFSLISEAESAGDPFGFSVCVLAVPPCVLAVTVLFSKVYVRLFSLIRIVHLLNRRPFSPSRKREACFVERQQYINFDGAPADV